MNQILFGVYFVLSSKFEMLLKGVKMIRLKVVFVFFLSFIFLGSTIFVYGENTLKNIQVAYRNIKIQVDGKQIVSEQEPFIYQGHTYVPLRTIGNIFNKKVEWNNTKNLVEINSLFIPFVPLDSFIKLLQYIPVNYIIKPSEIKPSDYDIQKIQEFENIVQGKDAIKLENNNYYSQSFTLNLNDEKIQMFKVFYNPDKNHNDLIILCFKFNEKDLFFVDYNLSYGSSDGWHNFGKQFSFNIKEPIGFSENFFLNYEIAINKNRMEDFFKNRSKHITLLYAGYLWYFVIN